MYFITIDFCFEFLLYSMFELSHVGNTIVNLYRFDMNLSSHYQSKMLRIK